VNLSFLECYQILDITDDCEWATLRKKYKTLIQRSHPDRFIENSSEREEAETAIKRYNNAYKIINDYYQVNKSLPPRSITNIETPIKYTPRKKRPPVNHREIGRKIRPEKKFFTFKKLAITSLILATFPLINYYENDISEPQKNSLKLDNEHNAIKTHKKNIDASPAKEEKIIKKNYFTTGSSLGEVIISQGEPSRVEGNTWYYGESSVSFSQGVVSSWYRHPGHHLNIILKETSLFTFEPEEPKTKRSKKPYWNK